MNVHMPKSVSLVVACLLAALPALASADTMERIRTSHTINFGYVPDFAPFSSESGGKADGYAIDLCMKIAAKVRSELALNDLKIELKPTKASDGVSAVKTGSIDLMCTPTPQTLKARRVVSFSIPVYTAGLSAIVRQDAPEPLLRALNGEVAYDGPTWRATVNRGIANHTYATIGGAITEQWIRDEANTLGVVVNLVTVKTDEEGVKLVADGKADAFFSERMRLKNYMVKDPEAKNLKVIDRIFEYAPVSMVLERGDEDFRLLVDTALTEMYQNGELEGTYRKFFGPPRSGLLLLNKVYLLH